MPDTRLHRPGTTSVVGDLSSGDGEFFSRSGSGVAAKPDVFDSASGGGEPVANGSNTCAEGADEYCVVVDVSPVVASGKARSNVCRNIGMFAVQEPTRIRELQKDDSDRIVFSDETFRGRGRIQQIVLDECIPGEQLPDLQGTDYHTIDIGIDEDDIDCLCKPGTIVNTETDVRYHDKLHENTRREPLNTGDAGDENFCKIFVYTDGSKMTSGSAEETEQAGWAFCCNWHR